MMKPIRILFSFLFMISTFTLFADLPVLDSNFLSSAVWGPEKTESSTYEIEFKTNNTYLISRRGEGSGYEIRGTYTIDGNTVILNMKSHESTNPYATSRDTDEQLSAEITTLIFESSEESPYYLYKLTSDIGHTFWFHGAPVPNGSTRILDGIEVVISRKQEARLLDDSKVRTGPGLTYQYNKFFFYEEDQFYLPKDYVVRTIARSSKKEVIGNWNDYWYYCYLNLGHYEGGPRFGWIYGALIQK